MKTTLSLLILGLSFIMIGSSFTTKSTNLSKPSFIEADFITVNGNIDIDEYRFFWGDDSDEQFVNADLDMNGTLDEFEYTFLPEP